MAEIVQDLTKYIQKLEQYVEDTLCQISWKLISLGNMLHWLSKLMLILHVQLETRNKNVWETCENTVCFY